MVPQTQVIILRRQLCCDPTCTTPNPYSGSRTGGRLDLAGRLDDDAKGIVHRLRIAKDRSDIGIQYNYVGSLHVLLVETTARAAAQAVFGSHVIDLGAFILPTHNRSSPEASCGAH